MSTSTENHTENVQFYAHSPAKSENHTDFVQFQTGSCPKSQPQPSPGQPPDPAQFENHAENSQFHTDQRSTLPDPRLYEWLLYKQLIEVAFLAAEQVRKHPKRVTLTQLAKLFDLASTLGRRATDLPLDPGHQPKRPEPAPGDLTFEEKLELVYGSEVNKDATNSGAPDS